ncbi:31677_t:CDS:2 [Gigaspora margarita]|uniref:31677_t:CDS:1 n=1 Tax=Gigaspora margarita TaxID=4874 RepID=A0ABN7UWN1_GIGMA|nr:31677_t:CDS:2 [Gigaspora margarita]
MDVLGNIMNRLELIENNQKGATCPIAPNICHDISLEQEALSNTHIELPKKKEYRALLWKKLDRKIQKVLRSTSFDPSKEDLAQLEVALNIIWENIKGAIIIIAKKMVPYTKKKKIQISKYQKIATVKAAVVLEKLIKEVKCSRINLDSWPLGV